MTTVGGVRKREVQRIALAGRPTERRTRLAALTVRAGGAVASQTSGVTQLTTIRRPPVPDSTGTRPSSEDSSSFAGIAVRAKTDITVIARNITNRTVC